MPIMRLYACVPLFAILACAAPGRAPADALSRAEAEALVRAYDDALASGDSTRVLGFWSPSARRREGFWTMHLGVGELRSFAELSEAVRGMSLEVRDVAPGEGGGVISIDRVRIAGTDTSRVPMRYHVVREGGRLLLEKPIDAQTRGWATRESALFRFHVPPGVAIADHVAAMDRLNREAETVARDLGIRLEGKLDYYFAPTQEACGALMLQRPSNGYASLAHGLIVSTTFDNLHEAVHLIAHRGGMDPGNAALSEGLAVAWGGNTRTTADYAPPQASKFLADGRYVPLDELFADRDGFFRRNYVTYFEAGAFVRYLIERFGGGRVASVMREAAQPEDAVAVLERACGLPLAELEGGFKTWLEAHAGTEVATAVPDGARRVFFMADAAGDDDGDGGYRYPNDRFAPGSFDLTAFEVLVDAGRVWFRIGLDTIPPPVSYGPGGEAFAPGVVIAIDRGGGTRPVGECFGVAFAEGEGWDLRVNAGIDVSLVNRDGRVFWSSRNRLPRPGGEPDALLFGLPAALIGRPDPDWKYFVGVGLVSDRTMDFLFGGVMPVLQTSRHLIAGARHAHGDPAFIDVLLDPGRDQARLLAECDPDAGRHPVVPMYGAGDPPQVEEEAR